MPEQALNVTELKERFVDVSEVMQADIKKLVQFQITNKSQSILKKIYAKNLMQRFQLNIQLLKINKENMNQISYLYQMEINS